MPVQVASPGHGSHFAVVCCMPCKTGLGRVGKTGSCHLIWAHLYFFLVSEGGFLDFQDHISQDISICIWPSTCKADLRSFEILSESRASFAEQGRANLVAHSQPPQAWAFTCQALANLSQYGNTERWTVLESWEIFPHLNNITQRECWLPAPQPPSSKGHPCPRGCALPVTYCMEVALGT